MIAQIAKKAMEYDRNDAKNIQHFLSVHSYAALIGKLEEIDSDTQLILEIAALLHDIGVKVCREKYGRSPGELQQKEGPAVARELLRGFSLTPAQVDRICYLIAHHHIYTDVDGMDYQILIEADFITNLFEGYVKMEQLPAVRNTVFQTKSGFAVLDDMFGK